MDLKVLASVFGAIFLAELGDKTQLATMLFSANKDVSKLTVFIGASLALMVTSALGVLAGSFLSEHINTKYLSYGAGILFIIIGGYTIATAS
jgi:putative Ca2+/H+ antiporter (TMEM165/GDT1 family)